MDTLNFGDTYTVLEQIGSGGGGTVYRAYHKRLQKEVALKKIHSNLKNVNARTETDILKNMKHEYLPQILDFLETEDGIYTVMEYIPGKSLAECLHEGQRFRLQESVEYFKELCEALEVLHRQNPPIIHGDIKPANIMRTPENRICLIDFNIASVFAENKTILSGYTPTYAAPEQISYFKNEAADGSEETEIIAADQTEVLKSGKEVVWNAEVYRSAVDTRADIYSLGATMYHVISGAKPIRTQNGMTDIRSAVPGVNPVLAHIVMKCVEEDKNLRYQSIVEVRQALAHFYQSQAQYKKLLRHQLVLRIGLLVGIGFFSLLTYCGLLRVRQEHTLAYQEAIAEEELALTEMDEDLLEQYFASAVSVYQERSEAYEIKARFFLNQKDYEACERFLVESALPYIQDEVGAGNLYLLLGECYLEEQNYEEACTAAENAINSDNSNPTAYELYAIALARFGDSETAKVQLQQAIELGLDEAGIQYTYGELEYADQEWDEADLCFLRCIEETEDSYMLERAYRMRLDIQDQYGVSADVCKQKMLIIDEALEACDALAEPGLLQEKAQTYIDWASVSGNTDYDQKALEVLEKITDSGAAVYSDYQNQVMLLLNLGSLDEAERILEAMFSDYGADYRTYMWYAFLEAQKQMEIDVEERDYSKFSEYYELAEEEYQYQKTQNKTDAYMEKLEQIYQEALEKGWVV